KDQEEHGQGPLEQGAAVGDRRLHAEARVDGRTVLRAVVHRPQPGREPRERGAREREDDERAHRRQAARRRAATWAGSSQVGRGRRRGTTTEWRWGGGWRGGVTRGSRSGRARVTGTVSSASSAKGAPRTAALPGGKPGGVAYARTSRNAAS